MLHLRSFLPITMILAGLFLMIYMINVESEPGALPLLLVLIGTGWFFITLYRSRPADRK